MKGIIMAGGAGSRLRPLTCDLPKPMVPIMNKPVMHYSIELLKKYGILDIGVTLQYLPEAIRYYFGDGSDYGVKLHYYIEDTPLGTAGSVKNAQELLDETFIVISGDALTDIDLSKAIDFHREKGSLVTMVLKKIDVPLEYGVVLTDVDGAITGFLEKPSWGEVFSDTVNTGIYILEPEALDYFKPNVKFDFSRDLFPMILKDKMPMYGYIAEGYWCDIGDIESYLKSHEDVMEGRVAINFDGEKIDNNIWIGKGAFIHPNTTLDGPCHIGQGTRVDEGASLGSYAVIGDNAYIGPFTSIKKSILWEGSTLGSGGEFRGTIICKNAKMGNDVCVYEGTAIGNDVILHDGVIIKPGAKIWPHKVVDRGGIIKDHLVWGTGIRRSLFGKDGIKGFFGAEINPWFVSRLGIAYGKLMGDGKRVALSYDHHRGSYMLKSGLLSGLLSSGLNIVDLGQTIAPISRYGVRYLGLDGGIHIRFSHSDFDKVYIQFFDNKGSDLPVSMERKLGNIFHIGDASLKSKEDIGEDIRIGDIETFYIRSIANSVDPEIIKNRNFRVAIINSDGYQRYLFSKLSEELGFYIELYDGDIPSDHKMDYDLTLSLSSDGEKLVLHMDDGSPIDGDKMVALISLLCLKQDNKLGVAIPHTAPLAIERMAKAYRSKTIRTKTRRQAIMEEVLRIGDSNQRRVMERFRLYFDGIAQVVGLMELMASKDLALEDLLYEIPKSHIAQKDIVCPWESKGKVMRTLIEDAYSREEDIELFEGIRINVKEGWALVLPDSDEPLCKVFSEGVTEEYAEELLSFYEGEINRIKDL